MMTMSVHCFCAGHLTSTAIAKPSSMLGLKKYCSTQFLLLTRRIDLTLAADEGLVEVI